MIIYDPIYQFESKRDNNFSLQLSLAFQHHGLKKKNQCMEVLYHPRVIG